MNVSAGPTEHVSTREHWERLVAVAMLGTDRRNPPEAPPAVAELVDDTLRATPAERMLAQVAAMVAVRRAGVMPAPAVAPLAGPPPDGRPAVSAAAVSRWYEVTTRWPVVEDEWTITLIERGLRVRPELVTELLIRHRGEPVRRLRTHLACGPLAAWLIEQIPALADGKERDRGFVAPGPDEIAAATRLPDLPVTPELVTLLDARGPHPGTALAEAIAGGQLGHPHRAVLVNLLARADAEVLDAVHDALVRADPAAPGGALAASLADLVDVRRAMLTELRADQDTKGDGPLP